MEDKFTMIQAAGKIGVTKNTLYRWEKEGRIVRAKRDRNNFRVYTSDDINKIKEWKDRITDPSDQVAEHENIAR